MKQDAREAGWHIGFAGKFAAETLSQAGFTITANMVRGGDWWVDAQHPDARLALRVTGVQRLGVVQFAVETLLEPVAVEMQVRPALVGEWVDKALGITVDTDVGDAEFDRRFVVGCAPAEAAPMLLPARARHALQGLADRVDAPVLTLLRDGTLRLGWQGTCGASTLTAALEVVQEVAGAAASLFEGVNEDMAQGPFRAGSWGRRAIDPSARERDHRRLVATTRRFVGLVTGAAVVAAGVVASVLGSI